MSTIDIHGGPGIGLFPRETVLPMVMREQDAVVGETYVVDLRGSASGGQVVLAQTPGPLTSPFANVVPDSPVIPRVLRLGLFCTPVEATPENEVGLFKFQGTFGLDPDGNPAETHPTNGLFLTSTAAIVVQEGLVWNSTNAHVAPEDDATSSEHKIIGINLIAHAAAVSGETTGGWFDGLEGFGAIIP